MLAVIDDFFPADENVPNRITAMLTEHQRREQLPLIVPVEIGRITVDHNKVGALPHS
ncbi:hypothetical protein D3C75_1300220 [compost metagenome]